MFGAQQARRRAAHAAAMRKWRAQRPNKSAAGITATLERQRAAGKHRGYKSYDVPRLAVHGTLDALIPNSFRLMFKRDNCPCCGTPGKGSYSLTIHGRRRLAALRKQKEA